MEMCHKIIAINPNEFKTKNLRFLRMKMFNSINNLRLYEIKALDPSSHISHVEL